MTPPTNDFISRRTALKTIALFSSQAVLLSACGSSIFGGDDTTTSSSSTSTPDTQPASRLDASAPYALVTNEVTPEVKTPAIETMQHLLTYPASSDPKAAAVTRLAEKGLPASLADQVAPLLVANSSSALDIVYPQLGGLTTNESAVILVATQRVLTDNVVTSTTRAFDVRIAKRAPLQWQVTNIESYGGDSPATTHVPTEKEQALLDNPRVELPDSARWDILEGKIDERVIVVLDYLSTRYTVHVNELWTGHPFNVFGGDHQSNHTRGQAVDIWKLNDKPVATRDFKDEFIALSNDLVRNYGVTELGGPWDFDGGGIVGFTNTVHQDHIHLGYDPPPSPATTSTTQLSTGA